MRPNTPFRLRTLRTAVVVRLGAVAERALAAEHLLARVGVGAERGVAQAAASTVSANRSFIECPQKEERSLARTGVTRIRVQPPRGIRRNIMKRLGECLEALGPTGARP